MSWTQNFNKVAVLTSKNPEAFLTFKQEPGLVDEHWLLPAVHGSIDRNVLYVNGLDINDYEGSIGYMLHIADPDKLEATFHVYSPSNKPFDASFYVKVWDNSTFITPPTNSELNLYNRPYIISSGLINQYETDNILVDDIASYMLLRTNPKYTGNIVLMVDLSNNMYLDTFKVSDILSNKKYRHQPVSGDSVLSGDIRTTFASLPLGELYRVDVDNTLQIGIPKTDVKNQYITTYNYGAKLIKDELYTEDNGILAPLWINSQIPDYFAAFRLDGVYNPETYDGSTLEFLASQYLDESTIVKSWSMKPGVPLGKYLTTHMADVNKIQAPVFLSLTDINAIESDPNTWYGIAVDKGVVTGRSETTYFFNQKSQNFTDLNAFVSQGFERNTLISSNLLNLEFIFSDEDVSLYTMSRYFGLYLTENVLYKIAYYADEPDSSTISIISLDGRDSSVFINSAIFDSSTGNIINDYVNRLFVLNDEVQLKRITNVSNINTSQSNPYVNKPFKNIFNTDIEEIKLNPFMLITLNKKLEQGEHLRIINYSDNAVDASTIWEVFGVDVSNYNCSRYVEMTEAKGSHPKVYRTFFDINGDISYQVKQIADAFDLFANYPDAPFRTGLYGNDWVSFILNDDAPLENNWVFQRITACTLNLDNATFNNAALPEDMSFFGRLTPDASYYFRVAYNTDYGPIDFEFFGDRHFSVAVPFIRPTNYVYSFDSSKNILDKFEQPTLYQSTDHWYRKLKEMMVYDMPWLHVKDPTHIDDRVIIMTDKPILTVNEKFNAFNIYPLNISLMGINPVKDIDYTVYDASLGFKSEYFYKRQCDPSSYVIAIPAADTQLLDIQGSYVIKYGTGFYTKDGVDYSYDVSTVLNTFDSSVLFTAITDSAVTYAVLDGSHGYKSYKNSISEERIGDYYDSSTLLKYGLTVPLVSKWVGLGTDCRNNPLRLILNADVLDVSTNFIPDSTNFTEEISYPSFKYLTSCGRSWEDYIFYDINDVVVNGRKMIDSFRDENLIDYILPTGGHYTTNQSEDGWVAVHPDLPNGFIEYVTRTGDGAALGSPAGQPPDVPSVTGQYTADTTFDTIKELMLTEPHIDYFSKLIYNNRGVDATKLRSSICYYNQYKNTIDVIIMGVSYSFKVENVAKNTLDIKNYDKYRFSFMTTAQKNKSSKRPIEVIINENTQTILMIWYQGNDELHYNARYSTFLPGKSLFDPGSTGFLSGADMKDYSFVKTPFFVNNSTIQKTLMKYYAASDADYYSASASPYIQFNKNLSGFNSTYNTWGINTIVGNVLNTNANKEMQSFAQYINYTYQQNANTFGDYVLNYGYNYNNNTNWYIGNTTNINTLMYYLSSSYTYVMYYILRDDDSFNSLDFGSTVNPISIKINSPRTYAGMETYNGWFKPKFNNVLDFKSNETLELITLLEKDFTFANTNLKSYNDIPQYWYNKVVSTVTATDVSAGNAISYAANHNVFKALWDADYYVKDGTFVDGYQSSDELSSFFGSKLPKFPNDITLEKWDSTMATYTQSTTDITLSYNITRAVLALFKTNSVFLSNWSAFVDTDNVVDNYVKNTILTYYNVSQPKIKVNYFYKPFSSSAIAYKYDSAFISNDKQNFNGQLAYENDEYIYRLTIPKTGNFTYFVSFTLTEK